MFNTHTSLFLGLASHFWNYYIWKKCQRSPPAFPKRTETPPWSKLYNCIFFSHLCLGILTWSVRLYFLTKILYANVTSHASLRPAHLNFLCLFVPNCCGQQYGVCRSSALLTFLRPPVTCIFLCPKVYSQQPTFKHLQNICHFV